MNGISALERLHCVTIKCKVKVMHVNLRLRLHGIGYVQISLGSNPFWYSVYMRPVLNWNGTVPHRITFISRPIGTK